MLADFQQSQRTDLTPGPTSSSDSLLVQDIIASAASYRARASETRLAGPLTSPLLMPPPPIPVGRKFGNLTTKNLDKARQVVADRKAKKEQYRTTAFDKTVITIEGTLWSIHDQTGRMVLVQLFSHLFRSTLRE